MTATSCDMELTAFKSAKGCELIATAFGWPSVPGISLPPPTESEGRNIFPKGRSKLDVLSYVHWKQPAAKGHVRLYKGKPIRTLD